MNELHRCLSEFREDANAHPRVKSLLKGWERSASIVALDTEDSFRFRFEGGTITDVEAATACDDDEITIRGTDQVLRDVFTGRLNPATAHLSGALQVFASEKDQVKLDAITLVLWG